MQVILSQLINVFVIASIVLFVHQFIKGLLYTPQAQATHEPAISYATLAWVQLVAEEEFESVDIIALAKSRMKVSLPNTIRELKALASQRKIKNYGKMTKAQLIEALSC